jgi:hypothetical protein
LYLGEKREPKSKIFEIYWFGKKKQKEKTRLEGGGGEGFIRQSTADFGPG